MSLTEDFRAAVERAASPDDFLVRPAAGGFDLVVLHPLPAKRAHGGELTHQVRVDEEARTFTILDFSSMSRGRYGGLGFSGQYSAGHAPGAPGHEPIRTAAAALGLTERRHALRGVAIAVGALAVVAMAVVLVMLL